MWFALLNCITTKGTEVHKGIVSIRLDPTRTFPKLGKLPDAGMFSPSNCLIKATEGDPFYGGD